MSLPFILVLAIFYARVAHPWYLFCTKIVVTFNMFTSSLTRHIIIAHLILTFLFLFVASTNPRFEHVTDDDLASVDGHLGRFCRRNVWLAFVDRIRLHLCLCNVYVHGCVGCVGQSMPPTLPCIYYLLSCLSPTRSRDNRLRSCHVIL
jgi:hypothetical protein